MKTMSINSLSRMLALSIGLLIAGLVPTQGPAQVLTHGLLVPPRQALTCLKLDPEVTCDENGVISVILHGVNPAGFTADELEITSLTPGVSVQPSSMFPVPANPTFELIGASIGQEVTLMTNAVDIGAGNIKGSDLCCSGLVKVFIPRDICKRPEQYPDLEVKKIPLGCRANSRGTAHICNFRVSFKNVGLGQYYGPLSMTDTYTAPSASVSNATPPWVCTNFPSSNSFTCNYPVTTILPGQTVFLDFSMSVSGFRNGGHFQQCAESRSNLTVRGQVGFAQTLLNDAGYGAGTVDGVPGAQTRAAVRSCQAANGQPVTGNYRDFLSFIAASTTTDMNPANDKSCINVGLEPLPRKPVAKTCPKGWVGTYPDCRKLTVPTCPQGTFGTFPNCTEGATGQCPVGSVGTYPNCVILPKCPKGTIGNWPFCVSLRTGGN